MKKTIDVKTMREKAKDIELIHVVSKEAYLAALIYDLVKIPYSPATSIPHILYASCLGPLLYAAYLIEKGSLWNEVFVTLVGAAQSRQSSIEAIIDKLRAANIHEWSKIKPILSGIAKRVDILYQQKRRDIVNYIEKVFGFEKFFEKLYIIYGFNPLPSMSLGSMLYFDDRNVIVSVYVNEVHKETHVLDLVIHELLHGLIRLNNIELGHEVEELLIDVAAPDGYLSELLGLTDKASIGLDEVLYFRQRTEQYRRLFDLLVEYYKSKAYERINIIEWLKREVELD